VIIDFHAHALSEEFIAQAATGSVSGWKVERRGTREYVDAVFGPLDPMLYDVENRLALLRKRDIRTQFICPPPPLIAAPGHAADAALARRLNTSTARLVAAGYGVLAGLAAPAIGEPPNAAAELREAIEQYGFKGVMLPTSAGNLSLDNPAFESLFELIEDREMFAFVHPTGSSLSAHLRDFTLPIIIGWPTETAVCVARLVFAGVLERHPKLKLVLAHGGGPLPYLLGRVDLGYSAPRYERNPACREHITRPPSDYIRRLYFDSAVLHPKALHFLIDQVGADHVVFGSDFPYEIGDPDGSIAVKALQAADASTREAVLCGNAERLCTGPRQSL
jgi:aminocarboxymuconate-semialdehyde decarboxylase